MINHAYTLLLNAGRDFLAAEVPGYVYTPPDFAPVDVPSHLRAVREALFGESPDPVTLRYRGLQLIRLISAAELDEYLSELDSRVTYTLDRPSLLDDPRFDIQVSPLTASDSDALWAWSDASSADDSGKNWFQYLLEVMDESRVKVASQRPRMETFTLAYSLDSGISSLLALPQSPLRFRFRAAPGASWSISYMRRPSTDFAEILQRIEKLGDVVLAPLFFLSSPEGSQEPFRSLAALWREAEDLPRRLGAAVVALILGTERRRRFGA